jgi:hypothetical protein
MSIIENHNLCRCLLEYEMERKFFCTTCHMERAEVGGLSSCYIPICLMINTFILVKFALYRLSLNYNLIYKVNNMQSLDEYIVTPVFQRKPNASHMCARIKISHI